MVPRAYSLVFAVCLFSLAASALPVHAAGQAGKPYEKPPLDPRLTDTSDPNLVWRFYPGSGDAKLPRVLLIGDSITYGYAHDVAYRLSSEGKAVADIWLTPNNLRGWMMLEDLAAVLGQGPYDVVHFNIGLHEWDDATKADYNFETAMTAYVKTMLKHARWQDRMKTTKARLIWANITPVSKDDPLTELNDGQNDKVIQWNATASNIMTKAGIEINDLYGLMVANLDLKRDSLHFSGEGSKLIAEAATEAILRQLPGAKKSSSKKK